MLCTITFALSNQLSCAAAIFIRVNSLQFKTSRTLKSCKLKLSKTKQLCNFICSLDEVSFFVYLLNLGSKLSIKSTKLQLHIIVTFLFLLFCRFCFVVLPNSCKMQQNCTKLTHLQGKLWFELPKLLIPSSNFKNIKRPTTGYLTSV